MDIAEIGIGVDTSDFPLAKTGMTDLDNKFATTVNSLIASSKRWEKAIMAPAAIQKQANEIMFGAAQKSKLDSNLNSIRLRMQMMERSAAVEQKAAADALRRQAALDRETAAIQKQVAAEAALNATKENDNRAREIAEHDMLATKYNQTYAALKLYTSALGELNRAHQVDAISTAQHRTAVEALKLEYQTFQAGAVVGMNRFANAAQQTAGRTNQLGVVVQQTGYQVGDFLVQVQSGQNWLVAFGQQATQLVGTLPLLSTQLGMSAGKLIAISTGLGIIIPLVTAVAAAFMRMGEDTTKATEKVKSLGELLTEFTAFNDSTLTGINSGDQGRELYAAKLLERDLQLEINNLVASQIPIQQELNIGAGEMALMSSAAAAYDTEALNAKQAQLSLLTEQISKAEEWAARIKEIADSEKERERQLENFINRIAASLDKVDDAVAKTNANFVNFLSNAIDGASAAAELEREIGTAAMNALRLADVDINSPITAAAKSAAVLAANLGLSLSAALSLQNMRNQGQVYGGRGGDPRDFMPGGPRSGENEDNNTFNSSTYDIKTGGGGGGGGSSVEDQLEKELEQIRQSSTAKAELEIEEYANRQETLRSALDQKMITLQEYNSLEMQISKDHAAALTEIDTYRYGTALDKAGKWFGEMASATQAGGEKLLRISKVFGAAEALINAWKAASQVLASPMPWWQKIPAAMGVLSAGMGFVNAIKSGSSSGGKGGGGGRGSASVAPSASAPSTPQRVLVQGINPDDIFTGQWLSNFFDNFYKENNDRGAVFMVNR